MKLEKVNPYDLDCTKFDVKPDQEDINLALGAAKKLQEKLDQWVLEQIPTEQLKVLIKQFQRELDRRGP